MIQGRQGVGLAKETTIRLIMVYARVSRDAVAKVHRFSFHMRVILAACPHSDHFGTLARLAVWVFLQM